MVFVRWNEACVDIMTPNDYWSVISLLEVLWILIAIVAFVLHYIVEAALK